MKAPPKRPGSLVRVVTMWPIMLLLVVGITEGMSAAIYYLIVLKRIPNTGFGTRT